MWCCRQFNSFKSCDFWAVSVRLWFLSGSQALLPVWYSRSCVAAWNNVSHKLKTFEETLHKKDLIMCYIVRTKFGIIFLSVCFKTVTVGKLRSLIVICDSTFWHSLIVSSEAELNLVFAWSVLFTVWWNKCEYSFCNECIMCECKCECILW